MWSSTYGNLNRDGRVWPISLECNVTDDNAVRAELTLIPAGIPPVAKFTTSRAASEQNLTSAYYNLEREREIEG